MEAATLARPLPHFDYMPTIGCEPSHRQGIMIGTRLRQLGQAAVPSRGRRPSPPLPPLLMRLAPSGPLGSKNKNRLPSLGLAAAYPGATPLPEAVVSFVENRSSHSPSNEMKSVRRKSWPLLLEATQRAHLGGAQQVLTTEQGSHIMVPSMVFGGKEALRFASPHNDPLVVEMKIASAIVRRILINTGSSVDIITWDCLKKLTNPGHDIIPLGHPIIGFGGQEGNPDRHDSPPSMLWR
ncbi:hypothetical protein Cgig2_009801 [Carnegiea gigantea]|uniref:Uncharacterized protein n=1 Tax=Carnegiea gigantea TaxID=171969 RepID=A0A9Q1JJP4_9CARY|nr:hypothetical protein Cgig2_009801 [Carnegiea gigantea]